MTDTVHTESFHRRLLAFAKHNAVAAIALTAALVSMCFIPPDSGYSSYFDFRTLCCLFGTLAVVCALKNIHFFSIVAARIIHLTGSSRRAALALIYITFIGSMLIANDMALITFLPLGYYVFSTAENKWEVALVFRISPRTWEECSPLSAIPRICLCTHIIPFRPENSSG